MHWCNAGVLAAMQRVSCLDNAAVAADSAHPAASATAMLWCRIVPKARIISWHVGGGALRATVASTRRTACASDPFEMRCCRQGPGETVGGHGEALMLQHGFACSARGMKHAFFMIRAPSSAFLCEATSSSSSSPTSAASSSLSRTSAVRARFVPRH